MIIGFEFLQSSCGIAIVRIELQAEPGQFQGQVAQSQCQSVTEGNGGQAGLESGENSANRIDFLIRI